MKIDISRVVKSKSASMDIEFNEHIDELKDLSGDLEFIKPIYFKGTISNINEVLRLEGKLETQYIIKCYRCMKDINNSIELEIQEELMEANKTIDTVRSANLESPVSEMKLDAYSYEGNYLDLNKIIFDYITLNLPMHVLCEEDCKGLCKTCGTDLNQKECECKVEETDSRMDALKNFFKN